MPEKKAARVVVRVQPNAGRTEAVRYQDGTLHVRIAAPPVKGRANQELISFLGEVLGVSKSRLNIERGLTDRTKVISVEGLEQEQVTRLFEGLNRPAG